MPYGKKGILVASTSTDLQMKIHNSLDEKRFIVWPAHTANDLWDQFDRHDQKSGFSLDLIIIGPQVQGVNQLVEFISSLSIRRKQTPILVVKPSNRAVSHFRKKCRQRGVKVNGYFVESEIDKIVKDIQKKV